MIKRTKGGTLLSQVHQVCGRVWNKLLRENNMEDMEGARGRILFALWGEDGVPIKVLCEKTSLDKSTLTGILTRLERDGFVRREQDENDKRSSLIYRTGKDAFFTEKMPFVSDKMNQIFYKGFTDDEIKVFDSMLERVLKNCKDAEN